MLDPALVLDLQRAVSVPAFSPAAVVRAWKSPLAERAERTVAPLLGDAERQTHAWRMKVMELEAKTPQLMQNAWSEHELAELDSAIRVGDQAIEQHSRAAERRVEKALKFNKRLASKDLSAADAFRRQSARIHDMSIGNAEILRTLVLKLRDLRAHVDTQSGAEPGFVWRPWQPNEVAMAALREAEAGHLETVTLDDLRAEILADG